MRSHIKKYIFLFFILFPILLYGESYTIAVIYNDQEAHSVPACITKAVIQNEIQSGENFSFIEYAIEPNIASSVVAAKQAVAIEADAVVAIQNSTQAYAISTILNEANIPLFAPINPAIPPGIAKNELYNISLFNSREQLADLTAQYIIENLVGTKLAMVSNMSTPRSAVYGSKVKTTVSRLAPEIEIKEFEIIENHQDFNKLAEALIAYQPDVLYLPLYGEPVSNILLALNGRLPEMSVFVAGQIPIINESEYYSLISKANPTMDFYAISTWSGKLEGQWASNFSNLITQYQCMESNSKYDILTVVTYDAIRLLIDLVKVNPDITSSELIILAKASHFDGVAGKVTFDEDGEAMRPLFIHHLRNDSFSIIPLDRSDYVLTK